MLPQQNITPVASRTPCRHFDGIDVIRGLCIMNVVLHHTNIRIPFADSPLGALLPKLVINALFWTGDYSVKIFFVVSGFLITNSILGRWQDLRSISVPTFYRLRFARIAPCLLALLAVLSGLHLAHLEGFTINPERTTLLRAIFAALTFHINWLEAHVGYLPGSWDVLWSLSVEETFYLAYPLLCRFVRNRVVLLATAAALVIAGPIARTHAFNDIWYDYSYLGGMDCIAIGCVTAMLARMSWAQCIPVWCLASIGGALILVVWFRSIAHRLGLLASGLEVTVLGIGVALVILAMSWSSRSGTAGRFIAGPATSIFRWYGRNSYEIYLTHMFVVLVVTQIFETTHASVRLIPLLFASNLIFAGVLGYAVARWFSEPMNRKLRAGLIFHGREKTLDTAILIEQHPPVQQPPISF
ncbi:MAG: acyltransferase [Candidatus Acidiferrum sp.]